jgi:hypothetical protein
MRRPTPHALIIGAVAALTLGMALVAAGVRAGSLFLPGVFVLGAGFVLASAGGIVALLQPDEGAADV